MRSRAMIIATMAGAILLCPQGATAEEAVKKTVNSSRRSAASEKKTPLDRNRLRRAPRRITFGEGDLVKGGRATGAGTLVPVMGRHKHSSLIVVRRDFLPEMVKSAERL